MNPTMVAEPVTEAPEIGEAPKPKSSGLSPVSGRLVSLDAFRGITIAAMLLVNNPGSWSHIYPPLGHAEWNGWTPTDLIFPFFVFIVGVAMTFSFGKLIERGAERHDLLLKTVKRAALIFLAGILLQSFPWIGFDWAHWRIPGVLQRIAVAYLFAAVIYLYTSTKGQVMAIAAVLYGYWALQTLVPVPGGFTGVLQPGLDFGSWLDRHIYGLNHIWQGGKTWDPEGMLSNVPAIGTALLGGLAGTWIRSKRTPIEIVTGLFIGGALGLALGGMWGWVIPINKKLWTPSYVLFTAGFAAQCLALSYWLIDIKGYQRWAKPFVIYGMNALAAFWLSGAFARTLNLVHWTGPDGKPIALKTWIYQTFFESLPLAPVNASLLFAIAFVLLFLGMNMFFYRKKIFIKL